MSARCRVCGRVRLWLPPPGERPALRTCPAVKMEVDGAAPDVKQQQVGCCLPAPRCACQVSRTAVGWRRVRCSWCRLGLWSCMAHARMGAPFRPGLTPLAHGCAHPLPWRPALAPTHSPGAWVRAPDPLPVPLPAPTAPNLSTAPPPRTQAVKMEVDAPAPPAQQPGQAAAGPPPVKAEQPQPPHPGAAAAGAAAGTLPGPAPAAAPDATAPSGVALPGAADPAAAGAPVAAAAGAGAPAAPAAAPAGGGPAAGGGHQGEGAPAAPAPGAAAGAAAGAAGAAATAAAAPGAAAPAAGGEAGGGADAASGGGWAYQPPPATVDRSAVPEPVQQLLREHAEFLQSCGEMVWVRVGVKLRLGYK